MSRGKSKDVRFVGVDLFAGAGGLTLGAKLAGIEVLQSVENDARAVETYKQNHPEIDVFDKSIRRYKILPKTRRGDVRILFGGPPCQGFSTSNQRTRSASNRNNWLFSEFLRVADLWKPHWIVFENVKGIAETAKGIFLKRILAEIEKRGYTITHGFLQAAEFGVPQRRTRLFVIGSRMGIRARLPKKRSGKPPTVWQAISDLPRLKNGATLCRVPYKKKATGAYQKSMRNGHLDSPNNLVSRNLDYVIRRYRHIPQGGNWEDIPGCLMRNYAEKENCHTGIYHRLKENQVSVVIGNFRKNMLIHPRQHRGLSVREAARLQSFPDSYEFKGSIGFQQQQVGNAVPPLLARAVFQALTRSHSAVARGKSVKRAKPKAG